MSQPTLSVPVFAATLQHALSRGGEAPRSVLRWADAACTTLLAILLLAAFSGCGTVEAVTARGGYSPVTRETTGEISVRLRSSDGKSIKPLTQTPTGSARESGETPALPVLLFRTTRLMPLRPLPAAAPSPEGPRVITFLADR